MNEHLDVDVLIIGTGPSGLSVALHLVKRNPQWAGRILMVDKAIHPRDKLCGGGITHLAQNRLAELGLVLPINHFDVNETKLIYENESYSLKAKPTFRIVRRREFDHWLVQEVEKRGVRVLQGEAVTDLVVKPNYVQVTTEQRVIHAQVVVGADGSKSVVRQKLKWHDHDDTRIARLLEVDTPENPETTPEFRDKMAIFDFSCMTRGVQGYYWDFPSYVDGQPVMNRGIFDSRAQENRPKADLKAELKRMMAERHRNLDDYKLKGHPIHWFDSHAEISRPRVLLTGDAAGADPLFGEGISFAIAYGKPVAATIEDAFTRADYSFEGYKKRLLKENLFKHLDMRVRLAKFAYKLESPRFFRWGWRVAKRVIRYTDWYDGNLAPSILRVIKNGKADQ